MPCYLLGKSTNNFFTAELFRPFHADFGLASPISEGCPTLCYKIFVYLFSIKYKVMLGAIIGDIAGSKYEFNNVRTEEFELMGPAATTRTTPFAPWPSPKLTMAFRRI